jgi:ABC-2 type transport system permease protein
MILRIIFLVPAIQLLILPFAADYEIKHIYVGIVNHDQSEYARRLVGKIEASDYFDLSAYGDSYKDMIDLIERNQIDLIIEIPTHFSRDLIRFDEASVLISANAVNGTKGNLGAAYINQLLNDFNTEIRDELLLWPRMKPFPQIDIEFRHYYNQASNYQVFMVPGILAVLLTMVGSFLAALNIVKEKEIGTIEQLNVSPLRKSHFILGKLIPFWILGFVILTIGLIISYLVFGIIPGSNIGTLYIFSGVYVLAILGIGLLISNVTYSQQQAMMVSFFFIVIFILLSGLYTPIESMPDWAQQLAWMNPVTYMVDTMRIILLKGGQFVDVKDYLIKIGVSGIILNFIAVITYQKRS